MLQHELLKEMQGAKDLIFDFNALCPIEIEKRNNIKKTFRENETKFFVEPPFRCD